VLAAAALFVFVGCGGGSGETPAPPPAEAGPARPAPAGTTRADPDVTSAVPGATRIVFLGDSLSAGYGVAERDAFPAIVERRLRGEGHSVEVGNAGVSGDTSAGGLARLEWVLRSDPDVLVVELGANDALRGRTLESTESNLRAIVRGAREHGARVLLLGMDIPTSYGPDYTRGFAELYGRVAREEGVELVPGFIRGVGLDPDLMQPDGLHPTVEGHRRLAERLLPFLRPLLP
jgi:acyl-CoA thioesterase-1